MHFRLKKKKKKGEERRSEFPVDDWLFDFPAILFVSLIGLSVMPL